MFQIIVFTYPDKQHRFANLGIAPNLYGQYPADNNEPASLLCCLLPDDVSSRLLAHQPVS